MATKSIAWNTGSGNITLTYQGQGDGTISVQSDVNNGNARSQTITIQTTQGGLVTKNVTISQAACPVPVGTVLNYDYTGNVQSVLLPAGTYKLQCWGAQGGSVSGSYTATGAKGGYSEGTLTLSIPTTVYIFVGGQGSSASTSTTSGTANGGWNGGGGASRYSSYSSGGTDGRSYPRPGGGATDISTVTSDMSYSSYRNNRSAASLNARLIVAGGGAGASARYTSTTTTETGTLTGTVQKGKRHNGSRYVDFSIGEAWTYTIPDTSRTYYLRNFGYQPGWSGDLNVNGVIYMKGNTFLDVDRAAYMPTAPCWQSTDIELTVPSGCTTIIVNTGLDSSPSPVLSWSKTTTSTSSGTSNGAQVGGGTSGGGTNPGTQSGGGGELGKGANMTQTGYRYCSGGGGGGYYGGGASYNDSTTNKINQSGGGSGYVGSLTSAQTKAGNTSFPKTSGSGNETGHSGNGYAKITRLS